MIRTAIVILALAAAPGRAAGGLAESWYLSRARANARIGNHAAAVEAFRKALAENPASREASRGLGLELLRNGETDRAVAELDRHLARFPDDREAAFEQARVLQWSRYAYRAKDAIRYLRMGLARGDDPARRRELARLLGRDRATLGEALAEYDRLLATAPADEALRDERLRLLLWDRSRHGEAVAELERREREGRADERTRRELARLLAEDPARAAEAADRYAALLARHPDDATLRLGRARALTRAGRRADARDAYAHALRVHQPVEARLEHADLLAADPATRAAATAEYAAALREAPGSRRARLALGRVLMDEQETSRAAMGQYEALLAAAPGDPDAHAGLARAYAWNGDPDRALAHARETLARRPRSDVAALARELRRGREPALGGGVRALAQPGGAWGLSSVQAFAAGTADPGPFTSTAVEAGVSTHRGVDGARAEAPYVSSAAEWRPSPEARVHVGLGVDGARPGAAALAGQLALERRDEAVAVTLAAARRARRDSFRALAGETVAGTTVGAATEQVIEGRVAWAGTPWRVAVAARGGAVSGLGMETTLVASAGARADRTLHRAGRWELAAGAAVDATHHGRDLSGDDGDPAAPRLFSPPLFAAISPRLSLAREAGLAGRVAVEVGPALQLVRGGGPVVRAGGDARLLLEHRAGDRLRLHAEARAERIGGVHRLVEGGASLALLF